MPKNFETNFEDYFNLPNPGLRSYFDIVRTGQPEVYRTTFFRGSSVESIMEKWLSQLEMIRKDWPSLWDFEMDLKAKVGPMSVMFPLSKRMKDIDSYYDSISLESKPFSTAAVNAVKKEFARVGGLRLRCQARVLTRMKLSTNSGNPYFTRRKSVLLKTLPCRVTLDEQLLPNGKWNNCAVLGWRGQEGGPTVNDVKQRVVWMFPFAVNVAELQFYQPFIEAVQHFGIVPAWVSMDAVDRRITKMFDTKGPGDLVICTDFTKFDQHFNPTLQSAARTIYDALLTGDESVTWLNQVYPIKYEIPLAYDYGKVRVGKHGMGSGSGGTNADETVAHRMLQYEAAISSNQKLNPYSQCLGDDGILTYPGITVEDVTRSYTDRGLDMNLDKQYASEQDCTYLRRWHHVNYRLGGVCVGVYSTCRAIGRLCMQERYYDPEVWSSKMVALRQLSILENVKFHPLFRQFVDFCMKGDKYRLGLDIPGFLDNIESIAREATELMPDFLGYTKSLGLDGSKTFSGISDWSVVRYLRSKI